MEIPWDYVSKWEFWDTHMLRKFKILLDLEKQKMDFEKQKLDIEKQESRLKKEYVYIEACIYLLVL